MVPIYEQIMDQIKTAIIKGRATSRHRVTVCPQSVKGAEDQCSDSQESL